MSRSEMLASLHANLERKSAIMDQVRFLPKMPLFDFIDLNPTERCNRRCIFCPRADAAAYPNQSLDISPALVEKIAGELASYEWTGIVNLCGYGEPLLHRDIVSVVRILSSRGIHTEITTNGDPLTVELTHRLHSAGLKKLVISLYDGPHQQAHFRALLDASGAPSDFFVLRSRWGGEAEDYGLMLTNRAGSLDTRRPNPYADSPCYYPCYSLTIDWNGDVLLCVQDWHKRVRMGNVHSQPLLEVWTGKPYGRYRRLLLEGRRSELFPCRSCDAHGRRHGRKHAEAWSEWWKLKGCTEAPDVWEQCES